MKFPTKWYTKLCKLVDSFLRNCVRKSSFQYVKKKTTKKGSDTRHSFKWFLWIASCFLYLLVSYRPFLTRTKSAVLASSKYLNSQSTLHQIARKKRGAFCASRKRPYIWRNSLRLLVREQEHVFWHQVDHNTFLRYTRSSLVVNLVPQALMVL